jgi:HSP20 family protein
MLPTLRNNFPVFLNQIFDDDFMNSVLSDSNHRHSLPAVNIREDKDCFSIDVAAPGLKKDDFKVELNHNVLTISSEKKVEKEEKDEKMVRREFSYSSFRRSFEMPQGIDAEKIAASHKDGILTVTVPKREEAKEKGPKMISIN